ncbi:MAG: hypothetical protein QM710_04860 [Flavobacterium sp.]
MSPKSINKIGIGATALLAFLLVYINKENGFFWDTIQLGLGHASFFYSNDFSQLLLPDGIDSGHIPAFGMYIALVWKFFGRSIEASHLAMLPFALGIVWQLTILCKRFIPERYLGLAVMLIFIDASLMSQITLVSPDVCLVFFGLLCLNSILKNNRSLITISVIFLFLTSMRGMMLSFCFVFVDIYVNIGYLHLLKSAKIKALFKRSFLYLPALLIFICFSMYHYRAKGWIGYHKDSPWAACFERVDDFKGLLFNIGLLGWRILDFGRIALWIVFAILVFRYKSQIIKDKKNHVLFFVFAVVLLLLPLNMLWAKGLLMHRYLMPIYLIFALLTAAVLFSDYVAPKLRNILIAVWIIISLSGNFWIYPPKVSNGWDATLGHLPYYKLRLQAIDYLGTEKIDPKEVDTFFPNYYKLDDIDLDNDQRSFDAYTIGNGSEYIFYSNIFNISDEEYDYIFNNYTSIKDFKNNGVIVSILKKKL